MAAAGISDASVRVQDASFACASARSVCIITFPSRKNNIISAVNVGISANNWFTWTDYESYDPETSNFGNNTISAATSRGSNGISTGVEVTPFPACQTGNVSPGRNLLICST